MSKKVALPLAVLIVMTAIWAVKFVNAEGSGPGAAPPVIVTPVSMVGKTVVNDAPGIPGITIPQATAGAPAVPLTSTAYTADDVKQSLAARPIFQIAQPSQAGAGQVHSVQFITAAQASALLGGVSIGRPDSALVCYVEVQGPIVVDVSPPYGALSSPIGPAKEGIAVFDAQTGNLLITTYR